MTSLGVCVASHAAATPILIFCCHFHVLLPESAPRPLLDQFQWIHDIRYSVGQGLRAISKCFFCSIWLIAAHLRPANCLKLAPEEEVQVCQGIEESHPTSLLTWKRTGLSLQPLPLLKPGILCMDTRLGDAYGHLLPPCHAPPACLPPPRLTRSPLVRPYVNPLFPLPI